ncbi:MAG: AAA family ATPase [Candidatus Thermoplasmatota archaeon]
MDTREYEEKIEELQRKVREQEDRLRDFEESQRKYEDLFAKIKKPPLIYGYIVRIFGTDLGENEVVVARGSDMLKVELGQISREQLKCGQYVWLHPQTYAIVQLSEEINRGIIGKVVELSGDRVMVNIDGDMQVRILKYPPQFKGHINIGYQVAILPPTMEIMDVMPNWEVKLLLLGEKPNIFYKQIGGLENAIERIRDVIVLPYKEAKLFKKVDLSAPRGILLYGPPGCGKTLLVKAVATENDMTFFNISVADILSKWVGESERLIKEVFRQAREYKPSIVFFDEIEALFTVRGFFDPAGVHKNIIAQILSEMDGIKDLKDVYVIGATNRPDLLDPALLRPGRFDEIVEIPRPNKKAGMEIIKIYLKDDLPVSEELKANGGVEGLRGYLHEELYGNNKWVEIKLDEESSEPIKTVKRDDIVSGALINAIVCTAKRNFIKRHIKNRKKNDGLSIEDIKKAIEEECREHAITELYTIEKRKKEIFRRGTDPMVG